MLTVKQVEFPGIEKAWRKLEADGHVPTVFQTYDWIETWWKHLGHRGTSFIFGIYDDSELIGIAPLYYSTMKVKGLPLFRVVHVMGAGESDYNAFILKRDREQEILSALLKHLSTKKWDIFWLSDVHSETTTNKYLETVLKSEKYLYAKKEHTPCPYIKLPATFEEYKKSLSKNTRQNMTKFCNRVLKIDGVSYNKISDPLKIEEAVQTFITLHQSRWQRVGQKGALAEEAVQRFHLEAAQKLARYLDLKQLKIDDKVIATAYSYDYNGRREVYLPGMDLDYERFSLGFVLMAFGIRDAIESGLNEFDFMRGDEEYKFHFTKTVRNNVVFYFSKKRLKFKLFCKLEKLE